MDDNKPWFSYLDADYPRPAFNQIRAGLLADVRDMEKWAALRDLSELIQVTIEQAIAKDPSCGSFLGELLSFLWKQRLDLVEANYDFAKEYAKRSAARPATRKRSAFRRLIHKIVRETEAHRNWYLVTGQAPPNSFLALTAAELVALPELSTNDESVAKWTDVVVYPHLRRIAAELRDHTEIGNMPKALVDGKFYVSRLKPMARKVVARIAALPAEHHFRFEER